MRRIAWTAAARSDLVAIRRYIADFDPHAAERMARRLIALADSLADLSERGRPVAPGVRQMSVVRSYLMRYRVVGDEVRILRIRHAARRPL